MPLTNLEPTLRESVAYHCMVLDNIETGLRAAMLHGEDARELFDAMKVAVQRLKGLREKMLELAE